LISLDYHIQKLGEGNFLLDESRNHSYVSGNKLRKFNGILKDRKELAGLITLGSVFSSHCLTTAFYGAYLRKPVVLIIIGNAEASARDYPHLKASLDFGARVLFVEAANATAFIDEQKERFSEYLWIPGGGHTAEAMEAYRLFFESLFQKHPELSQLERILLPYGTGTTASGICQAIHTQQLPARVTGVSVARNKERCLEAARDFISSADELAMLDIVEDYAGRYHERTEATEAARQRFFVETGVLPDPVYNAKSIEYFYRKEMKNTLVVNTGGMLNNLL